MPAGDTTAPVGDRAADPFDTAALRRAVLDAWTASPARFREDANAEEDLLRGGYRDRWFVELAQNAADAAERAGITTTLRVRVGRRASCTSRTRARRWTPTASRAWPRCARRPSAGPGASGASGSGSPR